MLFEKKKGVEPETCLGSWLLLALLMVRWETVVVVWFQNRAAQVRVEMDSHATWTGLVWILAQSELDLDINCSYKPRFETIV